MSDRTPAGWLPDPTGRYARRYFDGAIWTDHVANTPGATLNDPYTAPAPPPPAWEQPAQQAPVQQAEPQLAEAKDLENSPGPPIDQSVPDEVQESGVASSVGPTLGGGTDSSSPSGYPAPQPQPAPYVVEAESNSGRIARGWAAFRGWPTWAQIGTGVLLAILVLGTLGSLGGGSDGTDQSTEEAASPTTDETTTTSTTSTTTTVPPPTLDIQGSWEVQDASTVELTGRTDPATEVTAIWASGRHARTTANPEGQFRLTVHHLAEGVTTVIVTSTNEAGVEETARVRVTRTISPEAYKASAQSIPYDQLIRDPDSLAGTAVTYTAQVFQYDSLTSTASMLVYVTEGDYDFWDDIVLVLLDPALGQQIDNDDIIQFWGPVIGAETYETGIGGSNTVPVVEAMYMDLIAKE